MVLFVWFWLIFSVKPQTIYFLLCNCVTVIEEEWISICFMWFQPKTVGNIQSIDTTFLIFANSSIKPFFFFYWAAEWLPVVRQGWARVKCGLFKWRVSAWQKFIIASKLFSVSDSEYVSEAPRSLWTLSLTTKWKTFNILLNICEATT